MPSLHRINKFGGGGKARGGGCVCSFFCQPASCPEPVNAFPFDFEILRHISKENLIYGCRNSARCVLYGSLTVYEQFLRMASRAKTNTCHEGQLSFGSNVQLVFDTFLHCCTRLNVFDAGLFVYSKHAMFHCTFYWSIRIQTQRNPESVCQHKCNVRNKLTRRAVRIHITCMNSATFSNNSVAFYLSEAFLKLSRNYRLISLRINIK